MEKRFFGRAQCAFPVSDLCETQRRFYAEFLQAEVLPNERHRDGLQAIFQEIFPITSYDEMITLNFVEYDLGEPRHSPDECRSLGLTYGAPLRIRCRLRREGDLERLAKELEKRIAQKCLEKRVADEKVVREFAESLSRRALDWAKKLGREVPERGIRELLDRALREFVKEHAPDTAEQTLKDAEPLLEKLSADFAAGIPKERASEIVLEEDVYLGTVPLMIGGGEFIINGAERCIVTQIQRSPGTDFSEEVHPSGKRLHSCRVIPERGSWIQVDVTSKEALTMRIDRSSKICVTTFLRALEPRFGTTREVLRAFYPTEVLPVSSKTERLKGTYLCSHVTDPQTGQVLLDPKAAKEKEKRPLLPALTRLTEELIDNLRSLKIREVEVVTAAKDELILNTLATDECENHEEAVLRIYQRMRPGNPPQKEKAQELFRELFFDDKRYNFGRIGRFRINRKFGQQVPEEKLTLTGEDFYNILRYILDLRAGKGRPDDIDHLANRRVRTIKDLVMDEFRKGMSKLRRSVRERMSLKDAGEMTPRTLINSQTVASAIEYFFARGELSQVVDQSNPLSQLTHERRLSALGPGGLHRKRAGFDVRDVHPSHYGRICPIETPEGANIGLIVSLGIYASINDYGFIVTPFRVVKSSEVTDEVVFLRADEETEQTIAQADAEIRPDRHYKNARVMARRHEEFVEVPSGEVTLMDVSTQQVVGVAASLVPFLEHDDANRALMGSNMQRQAVPLVRPELPFVGTGMEEQVALNTGMLFRAEEDGQVVYADGRRVEVYGNPREDSLEGLPKTGYVGGLLTVYHLSELRPEGKVETEVRAGDEVKTGETLAEAPGWELKAERDGTVFACDGNAIAVYYGGRKVADGKLEPKVKAGESVAPGAVLAEGSGWSWKSGPGGKVLVANGRRISVERDGRPEHFLPLRPGGYVHNHLLRKYVGLNERTCLNQKPIISSRDMMVRGQLLTEGAATRQGELALGANILVAFMSWEGYNFEDAILVSEKLVRRDTFTSIHIEEFTVEVRETKLGREEITRDIPNVAEAALAQLDETGLVRVGARVKPGDILVGKIAPKSKSELSSEEKLLHAIFGRAGEDVKNDSLEVKPGVEGYVIQVDRFTRASPSETEEKGEHKREIKRIESEYKRRIVQIIQEKLSELKKIVGGKLVNAETGQVYEPARNASDDEVIALDQALDLNKIELHPSKWRKARMTAHQYDKRKRVLEVELDRKVGKLRRGDELQPGVLELIKVYVAVKRRLSVGDKMAGRHGNKGVVSRILPEEDMPFLEDGTAVGMVLNPLGVPSRMNFGQILEVHLGWAAQKLGFRAITPVFDGAKEAEIVQCLKDAGLPTDGKVYLYDGRTGECFDQKVTVGYMYMLKLHHLVADKIHARATGPYSLITQQPLGGKARSGGQRFGEMEVWALQAYGAANILQELLTVKSDDVEGRTRIYESMVKGENSLEPGTPVSFDVLCNEIKGLGLNIRLEKKQE